MIAILQIFLWIAPWRLRRFAHVNLMGWKVDATARIGLSIISARKVTIGRNARIGHGTLVKNIDEFTLGDSAIVGNLNLISGGHGTGLYPNANPHANFSMGEGSAITHEHRIDCADAVAIGRFSTVAGRGSQIWTHGIDPTLCVQMTAPVSIGDYVLIGTRVTILRGSRIDSKCIVAAGALVNGLMRSNTMSGGIPARELKELTGDEAYFTRISPEVD